MTIPAHWRWMKLKYVASLKSGDSITSDSITEVGDYPVFGGNGIRGYTSAYTHAGKYILIGRQGALCGNINYASGDFWASEHAVVVDIKRDHQVSWLGELLRSMNLNQYSQSAAQPGIAVEVIANLPLPVPPPNEQHLIADYLDREIARIDALVAEKQHMLALLEEKRGALISRAVTRGLNPNALLKPSGLDWLGDIPVHWDVMPIKYVAMIGNGSTPAVDNADYWDEEGFPWLNSSVVNADYARESSRRVTAKALKECHLPTITPPAVLVGITGQGKTRGMASVLTIEATINQHIAYLKPRSARISAEYLRYVLVRAYSFLRSVSDGAGSTKGAITCEQLANFRITLPPEKEQVRIVLQIQEGKRKMDRIRQELISSIVLLTERRAALITAAVTGQIPIDEMTA